MSGSQQPLLGYGASAYRIANSLRFRSSASAYLNRTPSVAGNRKTWTWSAWVKRGSLGANSYPFACAYAASDSGFLGIYFNSDDTLAVSGFNTYWRKTTQVFRDPSAWYHIVVAFDTTQATGANRVKMYINGVQVTAFGTSNDPTLNTDYPINNNQPHFHSCYSLGTPTNFFDGYLADINFIDGQALTPSSFGAFNATTGVWGPKSYTGTYGTNGFKLNFSNGTSTTTLGYDSSGNSNNWTTNNISLTAGSTYDWMIDSPTPYQGSSYGVGNYAVLNPVGRILNSGSSYSNIDGNLNWTSTSSGVLFYSTIGVTSGKWYAEFTATTANMQVGVYGNGNAAMPTSGAVANYWDIYATSASALTLEKSSGSASGTLGNLAVNDVYGIALDMDNTNVYFYKNNSLIQTITGMTITGPLYFIMGSATGGSNSSGTANFGQRPFAYTPPSGYKSLCTYNLPTPTIQNGAGYMAATLYTGTLLSNAVSNAVNGVSFKPDFVWIKSRSAATDHKLTDSVRGTTKALISDSTAAETTDSQGLTTFGSSGFTVGTDIVYNNLAATYVGWQWKAGGTAVTNTAGSITSSVSANTTSGFSVVTWTSPASGTSTVGHGLGIAPAFFFIKNRPQVDNWQTWHIGIGGTQYLTLNTTSAASTNANVFSSAPTSTVLNFGANITGGQTYVAYCFAAIPGYSAFGSYTGNGSADGPFVYCGFRPRWILIKSSTLVTDWWIFDTARLGYNNVNYPLLPDSSAAEPAISDILDILSNGFKVHNTGGNFNGSGSTYVYACFAENPFTNALAR